jgi:guanylate kinase
MKLKYLKVMNNNDGVEGAVVFDDTVSFTQRIEINELIRQSDYTLVEIEEEEYNTIQKKFEL